MAGTWRNRTSSFTLTGFDELAKAVKDAEKAAQDEGRKCFEKCAENTYDALYNNAVKAKLDMNLVEQINEDIYEKPERGWFRYEVGWKKQKPTLKNPIPDTYKVMFYNYGTPSERFTKAGASRGKEDPHPGGSHGFIKKAKLAAANKNKKIIRETLEAITKGLEGLK